MSGTGKSTLVQELARRGFKAYDADYDGLSELVDVPLGEVTGVGPGKDWVWREDRIQALLSGEDSDVLFLAGCSPNQHKFYSFFDHIVLLSAPPQLLVERLRNRSSNPFGKHPDEVARTLELQKTVEPALRRSAGLEIDTSAPVDDVLAVLLRLIGHDAEMPRMQDSNG
jgi:shikimate kinase